MDIGENINALFIYNPIRYYSQLGNTAEYINFGTLNIFWREYFYTFIRVQDL